MGRNKLTYEIKKGIIENLQLGVPPERIARAYRVDISSVLCRKKQIDAGTLDINIFEAQELCRNSNKPKKGKKKKGTATKKHKSN